MGTAVLPRVEDLPRQAHASWVVDGPGAFDDGAARLLRDGARAGEKVFLFGPERREGSDGPSPAAVVDPWVRFLDRGRLVPETMYLAFREQRALAVRQGFTGLRVIADMDWLLASSASADDVIAFELGLDRIVAEVGATVVCAYRSSSFGPDAVDGVSAVHPFVVGHARPPSFRLVAHEGGTYRLSGEVDFTEVDAFERVLRAATTAARPTVDVGDLTFIDAAAMRAIANSTGITLVRPSESLQRYWRLAGFHRSAPHVRLVA